MTTIMKMLFGLMKMVFLICWKILKIICGPMKDSLVHIGKGIWEIIKERYRKRKEEKAAAAAAAKESQSADEQSSSEVRGDDAAQ